MGATWVKIGKVAVDSGTLWLGDPCYVFHAQPPPADLGDSWRTFAQRQLARESKSPTGQVAQFLRDVPEKGWNALGVAVRTGYGDGVYDVEARLDPKDGRIAEVRVVFINPKG